MLLTVNLTGIEAIRDQFAKLGRAPQEALDATAEKVEDYVHSQLGRHAKTGKLESSLGKKRVTDGWLIGHDPSVAPYARFVHDGTGLWGPKHAKFQIRPKNKQALRYERNGIFWYWFGPKTAQEQAAIRKWVRKNSGGNARVMFRWPMHPGNKPDRWFERAAALAPTIFANELNKRIANA